MTDTVNDDDTISLTPGDLPFTPTPAPPSPPPEFDHGAVTAKLKETISGELAALFSEALPDLQTLAGEIAPVLVTAVATGDTKLTEELEAQISMIAEIHNIRANAAKWRVLLSISKVALGALSSGLSSLIDVTGGSGGN